MNTYQSADEMWLAALTAIASKGIRRDSRDGPCRECIGWSGALEDPERYPIVTNPERRLSASYAAIEVLWYLSGERRIDRLLPYAPQYARFAEDRIAYGAYGWRLGHSASFQYEGLKLHGSNSRKSQLSAMCDLLASKPETRQAVITMWEAGDLVHAMAGDHKDLPCTLSLQFIARDRKLHCIATMRSNDAWLGMPYDVFAFTCLQRLVAQTCGMKMGAYIHQVGSMHLYERNEEKAGAALDALCRNEYPTLATRWNAPARTVSEMRAQAIEACRLEEAYRSEPDALHSTEGLDDMLRDLVLACAHKWNPGCQQQLASGALGHLVDMEKERNCADRRRN